MTSFLETFFSKTGFPGMGRKNECTGLKVHGLASKNSWKLHFGDDPRGGAFCLGIMESVLQLFRQSNFPATLMGKVILINKTEAWVRTLDRGLPPLLQRKPLDVIGNRHSIVLPLRLIRRRERKRSNLRQKRGFIWEADPYCEINK